MEVFSRGNLVGIAKALGDRNHGLTVFEIGHLLEGCEIQDFDPRNSNQWKRLFTSFTNHLNKGNNQSTIIKFIKDAMDPSRYVDCPLRHKTMCQNLNQVLLFASLAVNDAGNIIPTKPAQSLSDAKERALTLHTSLEFRDVHPDVLKFCGPELVENNHFHAVLEAAKSIGDKLRSRTGLKDDGIVLAKAALGTTSDNPPMVAINAFETKSDKSKQLGFLYLVKGTFNMFRNPTAHDARIQSEMDKDDLEDLLLLASIIHRRLDKATITPRAKTG